jgi:hypothetical protein
MAENLGGRNSCLATLNVLGEKYKLKIVDLILNLMD